jgi:hypothetical protein
MSTAVVSAIAMCRCSTTIPPGSLSTLSPHGSPTWRTSRPMKALSTTRTAMSMPSVMMATVNTGRPTIGRTASRSTPSARPPVSAAATISARKKPSGPTR